MSKETRILKLTTFQTAVIGIASYFLLPNGLATAGFLTIEEREYGLQRLKYDRSKGLAVNSG